MQNIIILLAVVLYSTVFVQKTFKWGFIWHLSVQRFATQSSNVLMSSHLAKLDKLFRRLCNDCYKTKVWIPIISDTIASTVTLQKTSVKTFFRLNKRIKVVMYLQFEDVWYMCTSCYEHINTNICMFDFFVENPHMPFDLTKNHIYMYIGIWRKM